MSMLAWSSALCAALSLTAARAAEIDTNAVHSADAPKWVTESRVDRVVDHIQDGLEWDIRKVQVRWYTSAAAFQKMHGFGPGVLAVSKKSENTIHIGPEVNATNFDGVFGHELVHIILFQKYRDSIPKWLEEGLANYLGKLGKVDYPWLASQPFREVTSLVHPINGGSAASTGTRYAYQASTAVMEMIASQCSISDLLQLSVGSKLETYLQSYCGFTDLNGSFRKWVSAKAARRGGSGS